VGGLPQLGKSSNHRRRLHFLLLPILSGILVWASFPKINQGYLAWVALVPLVVFLLRETRPGPVFLGGAVAGMIQFLGLLSWIPGVLTQYGGMPAAAAWAVFTLMAAGLGCFPAAACVLTRFCMNLGGPGFMLLLAPAWVAAEYVRSRFPFEGFPWLLIGYSQSDWSRLIQVADISGVYGISFLVVWSNVALVWLWQFRGRRSLSWAPIGGAVLSLAVCLIYGSAALDRWDRIAPTHRAALLQGNLSIDDPDAELTHKYTQGYIDMADQLRSAGVDLLVLPESPAPIIFQHDPGYRETLRGLARRYPLGLVFNNIYFREIDGTEQYFNSAFFLDRNGSETGRYDKIHLVPFGEYIPLKRLLFFSHAISKDVGSFEPGNLYLTAPLGGHVASVLICFEAVFPDLSREFVRRGSELIINLTNDRWYGDTAAPYQHLAMARWRAIESRRFLLRSANSGITAIIVPSGRIEVKTEILRPDLAVGGFAFLSGATCYVRYGSAFPLLCAIILFCVLLWNVNRRYRGAETPVSRIQEE
jgi:apolipoprotein N-acyltransferase